MKKIGRDRRKHPRYILSSSVSYKIRHLPSPKRMIRLLDTMRRAKGKDVSAGGLSFISEQLLLPGTVIELTVPPSKAARTGKLMGRVVWVREISPEKYRIGVKFA